ncbi:MAG: hypothetical protein JRI81_12115 [Deltaproteobacteria bacterium]|nr:hypothetical protein [Deltaproteobacteria bacterium]
MQKKKKQKEILQRALEVFEKTINLRAEVTINDLPRFVRPPATPPL